MAIIKIKSKGEPYDFISVEMFCERSGVSRQTVYDLTRQLIKDGKETKLDICYPLPNSKSPEDKETGIVCIPLNDKAKKYLKFRKAKMKKLQGDK